MNTMLLSRQIRTIVKRSKATIAPGVDFDTIAREWRWKWSALDDKKSLVHAQKILLDYQPMIAKIDGVQSVQRIICGSCLDFKVIIALPIDKFKAWEAAKFAPEANFLTAVNSVPNVTNVETQTYTLMPVEL